MTNVSNLSLNESNLLLAEFNGHQVVVAGGYIHGKTGHMVEIASLDEMISRQSTSVWHLLFPNLETALQIFQFCFSHNPVKAIDIDVKKHVLTPSFEFYFNGKKRAAHALH